MNSCLRRDVRFRQGRINGGNTSGCQWVGVIQREGKLKGPEKDFEERAMGV